MGQVRRFGQGLIAEAEGLGRPIGKFDGVVVSPGGPRIPGGFREEAVGLGQRLGTANEEFVFRTTASSIGLIDQGRDPIMDPLVGRRGGPLGRVPGRQRGGEAIGRRRPIEIGVEHPTEMDLDGVGGRRTFRPIDEAEHLGQPVVRGASEQPVPAFRGGWQVSVAFRRRRRRSFHGCRRGRCIRTRLDRRLLPGDGKRFPLLRQLRPAAEDRRQGEIAGGQVRREGIACQSSGQVVHALSRFEVWVLVGFAGRGQSLQPQETPLVLFPRQRLDAVHLAAFQFLMNLPEPGDLGPSRIASGRRCRGDVRLRGCEGEREVGVLRYQSRLLQVRPVLRDPLADVRLEVSIEFLQGDAAVTVAGGLGVGVAAESLAEEATKDRTSQLGRRPANLPRAGGSEDREVGHAGFLDRRREPVREPVAKHSQGPLGVDATAIEDQEFVDTIRNPAGALLKEQRIQ